MMLPDLISSLDSMKTTRGKLQDAVARHGVDGVHHDYDGTTTSASGTVEKMGERARASGVAGGSGIGDRGGAGGVLIPSGGL